MLTPSNKNPKYILWLIVVAFISIILSGRIEYWMPEYFNMDMMKYREMAFASPELNTSIIQPYVFRIFAPWAAGILPINIEVSFYVLNVLSLLLMVIAFYELLKLFNIGTRTAFALTFAFIFNRYFFKFLAWDYFQLSDSLSYGLLFLSIIMLTKQKWLWLFVASFIGVMTRETALLIIPVGYAYLYEKQMSKEQFFYFTLATVPACIMFILIRLVIEPAGGDDLLTKLFEEGGAHFFSLEAIGKKFFVAFTPFALIPFLFYKELIEFVRTHLTLSVLFLSVVFTTLFGLDHERLMTPSAPAYFAFIGFVIEKYSHYSDDKIYLKRFLFVLIVLSFLSSFYHLWGLIKLPNSIITLVVTSLLTIATAVHFFGLKSERIRRVFHSKNNS